MKGGERLKKRVDFELEQIAPSWIDDYSDDKFSVFKTTFLSTRHNLHNLNITEEILKRDAKSILGSFVVAKLQYGDSTTHTSDQNIYGYFPKEQEVVFDEIEDDKEGKITRASAYAVVSKIYSKDFIDIFNYSNGRSGSVEMTVTTPEDDETDVIDFDIYGLTCLGMSVKPSCSDARMSIVRFSEDEAENYFKSKSDSLSALKKFAKERAEQMADKKTYKIDKSKEAMSDKAWGDVDKSELRNKIMEAKNKSTLVKAVYMLVEDDWEDAPSEHLKYPVMELKGDTFVYNKGGLSSALGYAKKENETTVVNKINKIYKNLGLGQDGKEEDTKMAEIKFAAVDIGDMWGKMWDALHAKYPDGDWGSVYRIDGIYEEDNKKFAIIHHKDEDTKYRLDFSLTEDGLTLSDEIVKVEVEIVETDVVKKFAEPENADKYKKFEDCNCEDDENESEEDDEGKDVEMSVDEMKAKMAKMKSEIEDRDNIIMDKDKELEELRKFKANVEAQQVQCTVDTLFAEVRSCFSAEDMAKFQEEAKSCTVDTVTGFVNKVKAFAFEVTKGSKNNGVNETIMRMSAPVNTQVNKSNSVWDRI